jgi:hypothetical protein
MASKFHYEGGGGTLLLLGALGAGFYFFGNLFHLSASPGTPLTNPGPIVPTGGGGSSANTGGGGYTIQFGETLSGIAQSTYGSASLWPGIYCYNRGLGLITTGPSSIPAGTRIQLPNAATAQKLTKAYNAAGGQCS